MFTTHFSVFNVCNLFSFTVEMCQRFLSWPMLLLFLFDRSYVRTWLRKAVFCFFTIFPVNSFWWCEPVCTKAHSFSNVVRCGASISWCVFTFCGCAKGFREYMYILLLLIFRSFLSPLCCRHIYPVDSPPCRHLFMLRQGVRVLPRSGAVAVLFRSSIFATCGFQLAYYSETVTAAGFYGDEVFRQFFKQNRISCIYCREVKFKHLLLAVLVAVKYAYSKRFTFCFLSSPVFIYVHTEGIFFIQHVFFIALCRVNRFCCI